jgi:tetratricopeptide (TPR) repeat protein
VAQSLSASQFDAALEAVESAIASAEEKTEMLMEIAMGMQTCPKNPADLQRAVALYEQALAICPADAPLLKARVSARMGTALQALPEGDTKSLHRAQFAFEAALLTLKEKGKPEEIAETEMNLGLVLQSLAGSGAARVHDAVQCYHRALSVFTRAQFPQEFAILHNNLAIAYLSIPLSDERAKMREALAVQSFEEVLKVVNLIDHPTEYAMIQNNLGNALQYAASGHALENNLRALVAYDEALKVRNARDTPLEYANTIANKANVLRNLPDGAGDPPAFRRDNLARARELYVEAERIFTRNNQAGSANVVLDALAEVANELATLLPGHGNGDDRQHV